MNLKPILIAGALFAGVTACDDSILPPGPGTGRLTITFDDGWESAYTRGLPTLRAHGLRGNVAVITESVDYWDGFLTLAQLRELDAAGWSLASHSAGHPDLTTVSDAELERQLTESKAWITAQGFRGSSVFVVPYHAWGERELAAIRRHYSAARIANSNYFAPEHFEEWPAADPYRLTSIEAGMAPFTSEAGRAALVEQVEAALDAGRFVDVMFHDIPAQDFEAFKATIAALSRFKNANAPYHELFVR